MTIQTALAATGLALACASGIARADASSDAQRLPGGRTSASTSPTGERPARTADAPAGETPETVGWLTPANASLALAAVGALVLLGRRRGFD